MQFNQAELAGLACMAKLASEVLCTGVGGDVRFEDTPENRAFCSAVINCRNDDDDEELEVQAHRGKLILSPDDLATYFKLRAEKLQAAAAEQLSEMAQVIALVTAVEADFNRQQQELVVKTPLSDTFVRLDVSAYSDAVINKAAQFLRIQYGDMWRVIPKTQFARGSVPAWSFAFFPGKS